jgi:uncharacterized cupin superfamily protein
MTIAILAPQSGAPVTSISDGWTVIEGQPVMSTWFEHQSVDRSLVEGTWHCTQGVLRAEYRFYEFVVMLEGEIEIIPDGGQPLTVRAGDAFAVEADFKGVWRVLAPVRKRFLLKLA